MLALLFPGQGSQEVGMGRDARDGSAAARAVFEEADDALGFALSRLCFEGPEADLVRTENQQPAILTVSVALLRALAEQVAPAPAFVAGHSLGEYTALVAADSLTFADAVRLVHARGRFMQEAVPEGKGAMAAILGSPPETVEAACEQVRRDTGGVVTPANYNSPVQTVVAGDAAAVAAVCAALQEAGAKRTIPLPVSAPFHCPLMQPAAEKLASELAGVSFADPDPPVVTNVEAEPNADGSRVADLLRSQVTAPVRFTAMVERLAALGVDRVLEVGPGKVLTGLVGRIDRALARANLAGLSDVSTAMEFVGGSPE